jgi:hypothetical protein
LQNQFLREEFHLESLPQQSKSPVIKRDIFIVKRKSDVESLPIKKIAKRIRLLCSQRR